MLAKFPNVHFSRFSRGAYFATKSMLQNSKFLRAAYIAAYKIDENSDETLEFPSKFTNLGKYLVGTYSWLLITLLALMDSIGILQMMMTGWKTCLAPKKCLAPAKWRNEICCFVIVYNSEAHLPSVAKTNDKLNFNFNSN